MDINLMKIDDLLPVIKFACLVLRCVYQNCKYFILACYCDVTYNKHFKSELSLLVSHTKYRDKMKQCHRIMIAYAASDPAGMLLYNI